MAITTIPITPGTGANVLVDSGATGKMQVIKLADSTLGSESLIPASATTGLLVNVSAVAGTVTVVNNGGAALLVDGSAHAQPVTDNSGSLTVDAPATTPVAVRLSTGAAFVDTVPVSVAGTVTVAGTVAVSGTVAATQSGTWNIGAVTSITNTVSVAGTVAISGTPTIQGTVTGNQGSAAALANAWPMKISDGASTVGISTVVADKALKVDVVKSVASSVQADKTAFAEGAGLVAVIGGVYNETIAGDPAEDQATALRITAKRGLHVNLRSAAGVEIGTLAAAVRVDPTGATTQPVLDTNSAAALAALQLIDDAVGTTAATAPTKVVVIGGTDGTNTRALSVTTTGQAVVSQGTANATPWNENLSQVGGAAVVSAAAGIPKVGVVDEAGAAFSDANPMPVSTVPHAGVQKNVSIVASQTKTEMWAPGSGKRFVIESMILSVTGSGDLFVFDGEANSAGNQVFVAAVAAGGNSFQFTFPNGRPSSAINNRLYYTSGAGTAVYLSIFGYEV